MKSIVYSHWDGSQAEFSLDAEEALDALSDLLMEGLDVQQALEWMRRHGFQLGGLDMRVMGLDEMLDELRAEAESLYDRYDLDHAMDEMRRRLDDILDREQQSLLDRHGFESARMNDFMNRRHAEEAGLADTVERFRDFEFENEEADA